MIFTKKRVAELEAREAQVIEDLHFIAQEKEDYREAESILLERKIEVERQNEEALLLMRRAQHDIEEARVANIKCAKIIKREMQRRSDSVNAHRRKLHGRKNVRA